MRWGSEHPAPSHCERNREKVENRGLGETLLCAVVLLLLPVLFLRGACGSSPWRGGDLEGRERARGESGHGQGGAASKNRYK